MNSHTQHNKLQKILTKDFLQREYVENQKLMQTIANDAKCGKATICRYLQEFGIKARIISVTRKRQCKRKICLDCGKLLGINSNYHDTKHCNSCAHKGKLSSTYIDGRCLKNYYCSDCGKQISATCAIYGKGDCSSCAHKGKNNPMFGKKDELSANFKHGKTNEKRYCCDCGIEIKHYYAKRCKSCASKYRYLNHPERNPNYVHGNSSAIYPPEFNYKLKAEIRKRDNYICQNCGMTEEKHWIVYSYCLVVHHIDYNKENCKEENLITVCSSCNLRANANRDYWKTYFNQKIGLINEYQKV